MPSVRANASAVLTVEGAPIAVQEGQAFDADHPVVREFPWLFANGVEEATARPGERRTTRRKP